MEIFKIYFLLHQNLQLRHGYYIPADFIQLAEGVVDSVRWTPNRMFRVRALASLGRQDT